jgi:hypothetical protein
LKQSIISSIVDDDDGGGNDDDDDDNDDDDDDDDEGDDDDNDEFVNEGGLEFVFDFLLGDLFGLPTHTCMYKYTTYKFKHIYMC